MTREAIMADKLVPYNQDWVWDEFVDLITVIWLGLFLFNLTYPATLPATIELGLLSVFFADLVVKASANPNFKTFVRRQWLDILMVIPYFRIFRILRLMRLLRILRGVRIARLGRFPGLKALEGFRRKLVKIVKRVIQREKETATHP